MILCLVEHSQGEANPLSLEALALGLQLARQTDEPMAAVVIGPAGRPAAEGLGAYGVGAVHLIEDGRLDDFAPEAWAASIGGLLDVLEPHALIAAATERGNEVMARLAASRNLPLAVNCQAVEPGDDAYVVTRQRWGGSLLEAARLRGKVKLVTVAANAFKPVAEPATTLTIHEVTPDLPEKAFRVRAVPAADEESARVSLGDARLVIGGGRGVGSAAGFGVLDELAALLGAAVGCSRAVTSNGWRPHAEQIGQTGERITADLYIACGISGAMQHIVGAKGARHILAVNIDPDATIMGYADYAVIGDLHEVLPALIAEVKKARGA